MARMPRAHALLSALVVPVLAWSLTACSQDPNSITAQAKEGSRKGYISGDGAVEAIPTAQRGKPVTLAGTTLDDKVWSVADGAGKVVVLNVWASWCPPCQHEAPQLEKAWQGFSSADKPVVFMGLNTRDNPSSGVSTAKKWGITFPSLNDESGVLILALQGKVTSPPTTLVLDRAGRIAARVNGEVTAATLNGLVEDVLAESKA